MRVILQSNGDFLKHVFPISINCNAIYLSNVSIPFSFYLLRSTNNKLTINNILHTIPQSNYNSLQIAKYISNLLPDDIEFVFSRLNLKYLIINNSNESVSVKFDTIFGVVGFVSNTTYHVNASDIVEGPNCGDIYDNLKSVYLVSNIATKSTIYNTSVNTPILAKINLAKFTPGSSIYYNDQGLTRKVSDNSTIHYIEISLHDSKMDLLELNGLSFEIEFWIDQNLDAVFDTRRITAKKTIQVSSETETETSTENEPLAVDI